MSLVLSKALDSPTDQTRISINSDWKFKLLDDKHSAKDGFQSMHFNDSDWECVSLPHISNQW